MCDDSAAELEDIEPELKTRPEVIAVRVGIYGALQRWPEMAMLARRLVEVEPEEAQGWIYLAYATRRAESIETARNILLRAEERCPEEPMIKFNLACYACQLGMLAEAKAYLTKAIRRAKCIRELALNDPDLEPLWDSLAVEWREGE